MELILDQVKCSHADSSQIAPHRVKSGRQIRSVYIRSDLVKISQEKSGQVKAVRDLSEQHNDRFNPTRAYLQTAREAMAKGRDKRLISDDTSLNRSASERTVSAAPPSPLVDTATPEPRATTW